MDALIESIDKQIRGNLLDMATATVRLEHALSRGNLEEARSLHSILPKFVELLFGSEQVVGWLELVQNDAELRALFSFLKPESVFLTFMLLHSNEASLCYELGEGDIGRKSFERESVFRTGGRCVAVGQQRSVKVSMFEFYLFYFCRVLRTPHNIRPRSRSSSRNAAGRRLDLIWEELVADLWSLVTFAEFHWQADDHAEVYFMLLTKYLEFCLPLNVAGSQGSLFNARVFPNVAAALKTSEFCLGMFLELWLNDNVHGLYRLDEEGEVAKPARIMTLDLIKAVQIMLQHVIQFESEGRPSVASRLNRNPLLDEFGRRFKEALMVQTYRFIRVYLAAWPHDASVSGLISLWHTFISGFEKPFLGLQVIGRDLLAHLTISLGHLGSVPVDQVDWPAMNSQLSALLQCTAYVLRKIVSNLDWLQAWEEQLPEEARDEIRKYEVESFRMRAFLTEDDVACALALVLERLFGVLEHSEPMHDNKQLIENCAGLLQQCFLVRVDFTKRQSQLSAKSKNVVMDRLSRKRVLIGQEGSGQCQSLVTLVWKQLFSSPYLLCGGLIVVLVCYIWANFF